MVGVAVKVTEVPVHILVELALIATAGVTLGVTVIVMVLPEAVAVETHAAFDVSTQVT